MLCEAVSGLLSVPVEAKWAIVEAERRAREGWWVNRNEGEMQAPAAWRRESPGLVSTLRALDFLGGVSLEGLIRAMPRQKKRPEVSSVVLHRLNILRKLRVVAPAFWWFPPGEEVEEPDPDWLRCWKLVVDLDEAIEVVEAGGWEEVTGKEFEQKGTKDRKGGAEA